MTILLTDDLFKNDEAMMIDECMTFIGAATQTTTLLISNAIYYLTTLNEKLNTARIELKEVLQVKSF